MTTNRPEFAATIADVALYSWESQVRQYPEKGFPGITYYRGEIRRGPYKGKYVDCLLYRDREGVLVGILNHYPSDFPGLEKKGNVNIWVRKDQQRRRIGTQLWREARIRYGVRTRGQRFTVAGARFAESMWKKGLR